MLEASLISARLLQYAGAMILMGSSLFALYALRPAPVASRHSALRRLLLASSATLLLATIVGLGAQTSLLAGSLSEGLRWDTLLAVATGMSLGKAAMVRMIMAALALMAIAILRQARPIAMAGALSGTIAVASLAWMGHAAAGEGWTGTIHLLSDVVHVLAAAVWLGALAGFLLLLLARPRDTANSQLTYKVLHGFSGLGSIAVATLVLTGLINAWVLVGPNRISSLWTDQYGRLLVLKIFLFTGMVALAAVNRVRLTPSLGAALQSGHAGGVV